MIFFEEIVQRDVNEHAGIGDGDKKEPFFDWKIPKIDAGNVFWIESPDRPDSHIMIPEDEKGRCDKHSRKER